MIINFNSSERSKDFSFYLNSIIEFKWITFWIATSSSCCGCSSFLGQQLVGIRWIHAILIRSPHWKRDDIERELNPQNDSSDVNQLLCYLTARNSKRRTEQWEERRWLWMIYIRVVERGREGSSCSANWWWSLSLDSTTSSGCPLSSIRLRGWRDEGDSHINHHLMGSE